MTGRAQSLGIAVTVEGRNARREMMRIWEWSNIGAFNLRASPWKAINLQQGDQQQQQQQQKQQQFTSSVHSFISLTFFFFHFLLFNKNEFSLLLGNSPFPFNGSRTNCQFAMNFFFYNLIEKYKIR